MDSKRPYSKKVMKRVDFNKCLKLLSLDDLKESERDLELTDYIDDNKFKEYKSNYHKFYNVKLN